MSSSESPIQESPLQWSIHDGIAEVVFNRPRQLNAFNNELMHATLELMSELEGDESVRVIVVRGAGRAFSAGFDLKAAGERSLDSIDKVRAQMELQFDFIMRFWTSTKPTIAAVHGYCIAGAFELSLACDMTVAARDAVFGEPEVRFGTGTVAMLFPWVTGPKQAKEILLTGADRIAAEDALRMGLVNRVVEPAEVLAVSMRLARQVARSSPLSVRRMKEAVNRSYEVMGMRQALASGLDIDIELNATPTFEKSEFARIRRESGVKAAIAWRDGRFNED
ncbi:MAG: enoyl-CoA hydratase/isomerase family protein [Gammaproteobacteria bacterium]|nr:enoyl-CoA hydratase/isomerase family protein [Gammaproteobacteria bacterium]